MKCFSICAMGCCGALLLMLIATKAEAVVLAKDSYVVGSGDYTAGGLNGQTSASATGFMNPWSVSSANLQAESGGILDGDTDPANGQGKFISAPGQFSAFFRSARRELQPVPAQPNGTYYMSHLVNAGSSTGPNQNYSLVGFGSFVEQSTIEGSANFLAGAFTGFVGDGAASDSSVDLVIRSRTGAAAGDISDTVLIEDAVNTTYNVVMALEFNNPGDEIRYWVDPTDFSNGEAGLDASAVVSGSIAGFQLGASTDMNRLSILNNGFDRSFFWDESILATEVADLNPIPEPSTIVLVAGLVSLLAARRKFYN